MMNTCLNFDPEGWYGYVEGYRLAGMLLVEHVEKDGNNQDSLVYPIVFTLRHFLELQMKELIESGASLLDFDETYRTTHDLNSLWFKCRELLELVFGQMADSEQLDGVGEQVDQLAAVDPGSFAFRYPFDRAGGMSLPEDIRGFNLRYFADRIDEIANLLTGASEGIAVYREYKAEAKQHFDT